MAFNLGKTGRMLIDAILVLGSLLMAFFIRYITFSSSSVPFLNGLIIYVFQYAFAIVGIILISLATFYLSGFYTHGRLYRSRYKVLVIFRAVCLSYLIYSLVSYLLPIIPAVPRSVFLLSWVQTLFLLWFARLWSAIWFKTVEKEVQSLKHCGANQVKNVLVIGGAGYIGSILVDKLLKEGKKVRVLDTLIYGDGAIKSFFNNPNFELIKEDFRNVQPVVAAMQGMDAVVHLGAIVGDPACALDEKLTIEINLNATRMIAEAAKGSDISRFVFASTCSVYGASEEFVDERSALNPVSLYAKTKIEAEKILREMAEEKGFAPIILRFSTIFGLGPRPRFDLVVNLLSAKAVSDGEITIFGGEQWRPFLHVEDAAKAVCLVLNKPIDLVRNQIFNVGSAEENHQINEVGELVKKLVPESEIIYSGEDTDKRNYKVKFDKIRNMLAFERSFSLEDGIKQVVSAIRTGQISDYTLPEYNNYRFLNEESMIAKIRAEKTTLNAYGMDK